ncbi:MAG: hypothetical protein JSS49_27990 [Planctomycetes bacterium]|nr:hypothetical protein [Planctomycetota bacterium]
MKSKFAWPFLTCVLAIGVSAGLASLVASNSKTAVVAQEVVLSPQQIVNPLRSTSAGPVLGRMPLQPFFVRTLQLLNGKEIRLTLDPRGHLIDGGTALGEIDALTFRPVFTQESLEFLPNLMSIELRDAAPGMTNLGSVWLGIAYPGRKFDLQPMTILELKVIVCDQRGTIVESSWCKSPDISTMFRIPLTAEMSGRIAAAREQQTLSLEAVAKIPVRAMKAASRLWDAGSTVLRRHDSQLTDAAGPGPFMSNSDAQKIVDEVRQKITDSFQGDPELLDLLSTNPFVVTDLFESPTSFEQMRSDQQELLWKRLERTWGSERQTEDRVETKGKTNSETTGEGRMAFGVTPFVPVFGGGADAQAKANQIYEEVGVRMVKQSAGDYWKPVEFSGKIWSHEKFSRSLRAKSQAIVPNGAIEPEQIALGVIPAYQDYQSVKDAIQRAESLDSELRNLLKNRDELSDNLHKVADRILENQRDKFREKRRVYEEARQKWLAQKLTQERLAEAVARFQQCIDLWGDWGGKFSGCRDATERARVEHEHGLKVLEKEMKLAEGSLIAFEIKGLASELNAEHSELLDELKKLDEKIRIHHLNFNGINASPAWQQGSRDIKKGN